MGCQRRLEKEVLNHRFQSKEKNVTQTQFFKEIHVACQLITGLPSAVGTIQRANSLMQLMWFWKQHQAAGHHVLQDLSVHFCTRTVKTFRESYSSVNPRLNVWGFSVQAPILVNVPLCILRFTFIFVWQTRAQWNGRLDKKRRGCWQQVVYCVPVSESKRQRWLPTYAAGDQLNQTRGGTRANFHTLIHLCAFTNSLGM